MPRKKAGEAVFIEIGRQSSQMRKEIKHTLKSLKEVMI